MALWLMFLFCGGESFVSVSLLRVVGMLTRCVATTSRASTMSRTSTTPIVLELLSRHSFRYDCPRYASHSILLYVVRSWLRGIDGE